MSIDAISQTIQTALKAAGLNIEQGRLKAVVTVTIDRALASAKLEALRMPLPAFVKLRRTTARDAPEPRDAPFDPAVQFLARSYTQGTANP